MALVGKAVIREPDPISGGLGSFASAIEGVNEGAAINEDKRRFQESMSENKRQFNSDLDHRKAQLQELSSSNQLNREQREKLSILEQDRADSRQTQNIEANIVESDKRRVFDTEQNRLARDLSQVQHNAQQQTIRSGQFRNERIQNNILFEQRRAQNQQINEKLFSLDKHISQFDGGYTGFMTADDPTRNAAIEAYAIEQVGEVAWNGDGVTPPMDEDNRKTLLARAGSEMAGYQQLRKDYVDRQVDLAMRTASASGRRNAGGGFGGDTLHEGARQLESQFDINSIIDYKSPVSNRDGSYSYNMREVENLLGPIAVNSLRQVEGVLAEAETVMMTMDSVAASNTSANNVLQDYKAQLLEIHANTRVLEGAGQSADQVQRAILQYNLSRLNDIVTGATSDDPQFGATRVQFEKDNGI